MDREVSITGIAGQDGSYLASSQPAIPFAGLLKKADFLAQNFRLLNSLLSK